MDCREDLPGGVFQPFVKEKNEMNYLEIEKVIGREILDSRGNPTVEAEVTLLDGTIGRYGSQRSIHR